MKKILLSLLLLFPFLTKAQVFWTENFNTGCSSGCSAVGVNTGNGAWTQTIMGSEGIDPNQWYVSCAEDGFVAGNCGAACSGSLQATGASLHIGSSQNWFGDQGASYDAGGLCGILSCPLTNRRIESPVINCTGRSNITLAFTYIEGGQAPFDDASVWYNSGTGWTLLTNTSATNNAACGGQGLWTAFSYALPASCNNNANVRIGFLWVNNDDGSGVDPSFAVDNVTLSVAGGGGNPPSAGMIISAPSVCQGFNLQYTDNSAGNPTSWQWTFQGGVPASYTGQTPPVINYPTAGSFTTKLVVSNANGSDSTIIGITVHPNPTPTFSGLSGGYCMNASAVTMTGNPSGGTFAGNGVSGTTFTPSVAGFGIHTITYSYTDINGCFGTSSQNVRVDSLPVTNFTGTDSLACESDTAVTLNASPTGGTFSGTGVSGTNFNPSVAGAGLHTITYSYTNTMTGCIGSASHVVNVTANPGANFILPVDTICTTSGPLLLSGVSPSGGSFSGNGVSGGSFDPGLVGNAAGTYGITYTVTDSLGCKGTATDSLVLEICLGIQLLDGLEFSLAPNPVSDMLNLELPVSCVVELSDVNGRIISTSEMNAGTHSISFTNLAPGTYFLELNAGRDKVVRKILKK